MTDFQRPENKLDLDNNFEQLKPLMKPTEAFYESSRCLFCYDAPCVRACPTEIDIPLFIRQINTENVTGAAKTIYQSNYFGHICGKVCPTEELCEGACVYNEQDVKPIEIGRLQSFATTHAISQATNISIRPPNSTIQGKIAIVGAGPSGIACACELSDLGYEVNVYEEKMAPSGLALFGTAPYKITNEEVLEEVNYLQKQFGFTIKYNSGIYSREDFTRLESGHDAIFLGIGLGNTRALKIPGEELDGSVGATEFIEKLKSKPLSVEIGSRVVVIGGGNTAMDASSEVARMGSEAVLLYRRDKASMSAYGFEYDLIKQAGADAIFNVRVVEIIGDQEVEAVRCVKTMKKNNSLADVEGSEFTIPCNMVIRATGQEKQIEIFKSIGLDYNERGVPITIKGSYQCSSSKYFIGGDALNGGAEVVNACAEGKAAAREMHQFLH